MVKSISIDLSEAWSPLGDRMWLPWLLVIWPILFLATKLLALQRRSSFLNYLAVIETALGGFGALMIIALVLQMGPVDQPIQHWWLAGEFCLVVYFGWCALSLSWGKVGTISPFQYVMAHTATLYRRGRHQAGWRARGQQGLKWFNWFTTVSATREESLAEYYRYRWLVYGLLVLSLVTALYWCALITPRDLLSGTILITSGVFIFIMRITRRQLSRQPGLCQS